ncbi:glycoside hydrolase family 20 protein [Rapidithrix thailandica]|uniref:beta-N-acetylhexosaminidase n=1 Tax=Rapidithrix thailandica TaxID=413964 RepID=A0AAW9S4X5_9BACT
MTTRIFKYALLLLFAGSCLTSCELKQNEKTFTEKEVNIVPKPLKLELGKKSFQISSKTSFYVEDDAQVEIVRHLTGLFKTVAGWEPEVKVGEKATKNAVVLSTKEGMGEEAYELTVTPELITMQASAPAGFFYGIQTLRQLLPVQIEGTSLAENTKWLVPEIHISDAPRFVWRGFMLDVSRHFFTKEEVKKVIDYMAMHKMNTFHWHLIDDQGWRIEIKKYPKLTEVGAWRVDHEDKQWSARPRQQPGEKATYGGFYTQEDIKEVIAYAKSRYINVVPEIEMPAHVSSGVAAYPEFSCKGEPVTVPSGGLWPITDIYCAGNDATFTFLEDVLTEVMALFPSPYIHIGGDEATKTEWARCAKCQKRIQTEGLNNVEELQSYFVKRIETFLNENNRTLIGWDEILEGGLAPKATVMSWRGFKGGVEAAEHGHDVVMSPTSHCYFDYYQGPQDQEPPAFNAYLPLSKVYQFDPVHESMNEEQAKRVLGGQANLWTEHVPNFEHLQYMAFPRLAAMGEALWTPKAQLNWDDFIGRMETQLQRYDAKGINYAKSIYTVTPGITFDPEKKSVAVALSTEASYVDIHYTIDGSEPGTTSPKYSQPFALEQSATIKAVSVKDGKLVGKVMSKKIDLHKATVKKVTYEEAPHKSYPGTEYTLVDCLKGSSNHSDGHWQGWEGKDMDIVIDLEKEIPVNHLTINALQKSGAWIILPKEVEFQVSTDGENFTKVGAATHTIDPLSPDTMMKELGVEVKDLSARYVKVIARNFGKGPKGHMAEGKNVWLFVSEVIVE